MKSIIGSIAFKITLVLVAMGAMVGVSILVSNSVFRQTVTSLDTLANQRLEELTTISELVTNADQLKSELVDVLLASDQAALAEATGTVAKHMAEMTELSASFPPELGDILNTQIGAALRDFKELDQMRAANFSNLDDLRDRITALRAAAAETNRHLKSVSTTAYFDLVVGGDDTVSALDDRLTHLVDGVVAALQNRYRINADVNLLTGVALALTQTADDSLISILKDLSKSALGDLRLAVDEANANTSLSFDTTPIEDSYALFEKVLSSSTFVIKGQKDNIVAAQRDLGLLVASQVDDLIFSLAIESETASENTSTTIQNLLDGPVARIKMLASVDVAVWAYVGGALELAASENQKHSAALNTELAKLAQSLTQMIPDSEVVLAGKVAQLITFSDPDTGIFKHRKAINDSVAESENALKKTVESVRSVGKTAAEAGKATRSQIKTDSLAVLDQAKRAGVQLLNIGWISLGVFLGAIALTFLTLVRPLQRLTGATEALASGDLEQDVPFAQKGGEVGRMARALLIFRDGLVEKQQMQAKEEEERTLRQQEQELIVSSLAEGMNRLADGDLAVQITQTFPGDYERLRRDFNQATSTLHDAIQRIANSAASVNDSSSEISNASDDLARRTEHATATLAETAAALAQMTISVQGSAERAESALQVVSVARSSAEEGKTIVESTVVAMRLI
ncbi:MAG: HAMP domain-containing protein, partial [Rhodobacterales bacterium]